MMPLYCSHGHENSPGSHYCKQCGEKLPQVNLQRVSPGMVLGDRYRIIRELGHGGFGRTYLAEDLNRFNEPCVLKEFAPQVRGTYALQKAEELFEREAGVLYKLQHPQIPRFRELFRVKQEHSGFLFLVQDFVEGQTYQALLDRRRRQGQRFSETEVTQLLVQILPVLEYIHSLGVIHRDISPDNLMLRNNDGLPVLIDFGGVKQVAASLASQFRESASGVGIPAVATQLGKVGYAPVEQMQRGIVSPNSDCYALAVTVLVLLTGKEPQQLIDSQTLALDWRREVSLSGKLAEILDKMLQPTPGDRYQSAGEILQAMTGNFAPAYFPPTQPVAPKTAATVAIASPPVAATVEPAANQPVIPVPHQKRDRSFGWLGKVVIAVVLIASASGLGWWAGNSWIQSQSPEIVTPPNTDDTQAPPSDEPEPEPPSQFSAEERQRKQTLRERRLNLGVGYRFYVNWVNEVFWTQYPNQRGRRLGNGSEDAQLRKQWDTIAAEQLEKIAQAELSAATRRGLGNYGEADRTRWKAEANQLRLSSRALYDLADAKFFHNFPKQRGEDFLESPVGQVWQAYVADSVSALRTGAAYERIVFDPGAVSKQIRGTLRPGEGKAFVAELSQGQTIEIRLDTAQNALFSVYSPTGEVAILEDSRDRRWAGRLPESGFYEFTVVSEASEPIDYQLNLTVEKPPSPEASEVPSREGVEN
jgi:serine/threonine-protein kinase